ncbi:MAG: hypothetical protein AAGB19_16975 [Cyanobacteria bacterium P01_F01_bin.3]
MAQSTVTRIPNEILPDVERICSAYRASRDLEKAKADLAAIGVQIQVSVQQNAA